MQALFISVSVKSKTRIRPNVTEESRSIMRDVLRYEIEFYNFVKERFYSQLATLKRKSLIT